MTATIDGAANDIYIVAVSPQMLQWLNQQFARETNYPLEQWQHHTNHIILPLCALLIVYTVPPRLFSHASEMTE